MNKQELASEFARIIGCEVTPEIVNAIGRAKRLLSAGPEVALAAILLGMTGVPEADDDPQPESLPHAAHSDEPSETEELVDGDVVSEAEQIRRVLTEAPELTNKQIIDKLGESGVKVNSSQVKVARKQLAALSESPGE